MAVCGACLLPIARGQFRIRGSEVVHPACVNLPSAVAANHAGHTRVLQGKLAVAETVAERRARELEEARSENQRLRAELADARSRARQAEQVPALMLRVRTLESIVDDHVRTAAERDTELMNRQRDTEALRREIAALKTPAPSQSGNGSTTPDLEHDSSMRFGLLDLE